MIKSIKSASYIAILFIFIGIACATPKVRPLGWAQPIINTRVENFHKVSDRLYRSAQPTSEGMKELASNGIATIINLRRFHDDEDEAKGCEFDLKHVKMNAWNIHDEQVVKALKLIKDSKKPVLVHCMHGADRTGLICAMYRIIFENWPKEEALDEMVNGGYGYHSMWKNIPRYIREADTDKIKAKINDQ
ncbi:dual specificity protein phosphatase family protein [Desulfococcaceae bacterium HSG8]|nr:dual specificity protein phosphatase family protein [Desulfococcaceae bacterium HSG8]